MEEVYKLELTDLNVLFTAMLTVCGKVSFMNLSRYSDCDKNSYRCQSKTRLKVAKFNAAFVEIEILEEHEVIGLLDASFSPKSCKQTFSYQGLLSLM